MSCTCGHDADLHTHYRSGDDCGACACHAYNHQTRNALIGLAYLIIVLIVGFLILLSCFEASGYAATKRCETTTCMRAAIRWQKHENQTLRRRLHHHTAIDLHRAIAISSDLFGVSERAMTCVAWAESGYGRQTTPEPSSGALGPFQWLASSWLSTPLGRAGYSRLDPLAASLTTAQRVVVDHGWREWVTGTGCGLR